MARDAAHIIPRWMLASAMSLGCLTAVAQEATPTAGEEARAFASDQELSAVTPPEPARLAETTARIQEKAPVERTEIITERYPNRTVKVERRVVQDAEGNYVNHGLWTLWNQQGEVIGSGDFKHGKRHGKWVRWHEAGEATMFTGPAFKHFQAPFSSEAQFVDGKLHGTWACFDANNRKICTFDFVDGQLNGKAVWFFPQGHKRREVDYVNARIDGLVMEWALEEQVVATETKPAGKGKTRQVPQVEIVPKLVSKILYEEGRKHLTHVEYYAPGVKKLEGEYLTPSDSPVVAYDWWAGVIKFESDAKPAQTAKGQKNGVWTGWYQDGGRQWQGEYRDGLAVGTHVWWHPNGQKQIEGKFEQGKEGGKWTWWYASGQKHVQGEYLHGEQTGAWTRWGEAGQVVEVEQFTPGQVLEQPQFVAEEAPKRPARLPAVQLEANGKSSSRRPAASMRR